MQIIQVDRNNKRVTFQENEMQFTIARGEMAGYVVRQPNFVEFKKALKQFHGIFPKITAAKIEKKFIKLKLNRKPF